MGIDIDSFLEKFDVKEKENNSNIKQDYIEKLNFQKEVEGNLTKIQEEGINSEFDILKKVYSQVQDFDSDLIAKFTDIESKGKVVLKNLGEKYSSFYFNALKNNLNILKNDLDKLFNEYDIISENKDFTNLFKIYNQIVAKFSSFPNEFLSEKILYINKIKTYEIKLFKLISDYKKNDLLIIKNNIKTSILKLNNSLRVSNLEIIRNNIDELNNLILSVPSIFTSEIIFERVSSSKILIKAENFLKSEYLEEFKLRKKIILDLFSKFQKKSIQSDVNSTILIYDEILLKFNSLPDVLLEEKIQLFKEINILSSQINDLMIKNRVNIFLEGYNYSKTFDEIKNHLFHIKRVGRVDISTLIELKNKLIMIPDKFAFQRDELLGEINSFLIKFSKLDNKLKKENLDFPNNNIEKNREDNINSEEIQEELTEKEILDKKRKFFEERIKFNQKRVDFEIKQSKKIINDDKKNQNTNSKNINNSNIKKIEMEVNKYFKIIVDSKDVSQVKIAYKKILFYIDILSISKSKKQILKSKVINILKEKKFK